MSPLLQKHITLRGQVVKSLPTGRFGILVQSADRSGTAAADLRELRLQHLRLLLTLPARLPTAPPALCVTIKPFAYLRHDLT